MKPGGTAGSACSGGEHYRFGRIAVDVPAHILSRDGQPQALEPKAFAVLITLLRRPGELLGRDELLDEVWGHRHVTPGVLTRAIA
jgi:DNA-binding winged helix-turn-helix (wHTH) protein